MIRYRLNPIILLINNGGYTIEVRLPYKLSNLFAKIRSRFLTFQINSWAISSLELLKVSTNPMGLVHIRIIHLEIME